MTHVVMRRGPDISLYICHGMARSVLQALITLHVSQPPSADQMSDSDIGVSTQHHLYQSPTFSGNSHRIIVPPKRVCHGRRPDNPGNLSPVGLQVPDVTSASKMAPDVDGASEYAPVPKKEATPALPTIQVSGALVMSISSCPCMNRTRENPAAGVVGVSCYQFRKLLLKMLLSC